MSVHRWSCISIYLILLLIGIQFNACIKEELNLRVKSLQIRQAYIGDTLTIDYTVEGSDYDSVGLLLNDSVGYTNLPSQSAFIFIINNSGSFELKLSVYRNSKIIETKIVGRIIVYKAQAPVKITYTNYDGGEIYFVGDRLRIGLSPDQPGTNLSDFRETTVYLNEVSLGTKTTLPFAFMTDTIVQDTNRIKVIMVDSDNHIYTSETILIVPVNTPPQIILQIGIQSSIVKSGHFLSTDPFFILTHGLDNILLEYFNYYLDNKLIMTDIVNSPQYFRQFIVDTLSAGEHTIYCIAYDDRGDSTISETSNITIYKAIDIHERINDFLNTGDENLVYAISGSSLYSIDPIREIILNKIALPFKNAICMDYDKDNHKLYIGFDDGHLVCYNEIPGNFVTIWTTVNEISDIGISSDLGIVIITSGTRISLLNLGTDKLITSGINLYEGSKLKIIKPDHKVIAGGKPGSSLGYIYKFSYDQDTLIMEMKNEKGGYLKDLYLKPDNSQFVYMSSHNTSGLPVYSVNNLDLATNFGETYAIVGGYNTNGNYFYAGFGEGKLTRFDADTYVNQSDYTIYLLDYIQFDKMTSIANDTRIVFSTMHMINDNQGELVFFRTTD